MMMFAALLALVLTPARADDKPALGDVAAVLQSAHSSAPAMPAAAGKPPRALPGPASVDNPWRRAASPAPGRAESIGAYAAGCLRGAQALDVTGPGYEVMRLSRRRFYGHPRLVAFIRRLAARASDAGLNTLLIGDLGQPRGGPTLSGHNSHQTGLDVDIWYRQAAPGARVTPADREQWDSPSMVVPDFERLNRYWNPNEIEILKLAAGDPAVERVFVNPVIKKTICARYPGESWVGKLRPWWGHDDHFHARLTCTPGDRDCVNLADPIAAGDGCDGTLENWFSPLEKAKALCLRTRSDLECLKPGMPRKVPEPPKLPELPPRCQQVLAD